MSSSNKNDEPETESQGSIPILEWIVATLGLAFVLGSMGFLAQRSLREPLPPHFVAKVLSIEPVAQGFFLNVLVENLGGKTVADLNVTAHFDHESQKSIEVVLQYLPAHSSRRFGLVLPASKNTTIINAKAITFEFKSFTWP